VASRPGFLGATGGEQRARVRATAVAEPYCGRERSPDKTSDHTLVTLPRVMKRATKDSEGWRAAAATASLPDVDQGIIKHPRSSTDVAFVGRRLGRAYPDPAA
jgi:hypothetical protein